MKNNKKTLFILIPALIAIWGLIAYKIFAVVDTPEVTTPSSSLKTIKLNSKADTLDFELFLSYADPFKISNNRTRITKAIPALNKTVIIPRKKESIETLEWPSINYGGMVKSSNQRQVALLTVNGKEYIVNKMEEIEGVKILNYTIDEIKVKFSGEEKTIKK